MTEVWETRVAGKGCPFDGPRGEASNGLRLIETLEASSLYLEPIQTYAGHCVLVYDLAHVTRIDELTPKGWQTLAADIHRAERALMQVFKPDHINVASLGQVVPHLHWHIIPRYKSDPRWGGPIWTTDSQEMQQVLLDESAYEERQAQIKDVLAAL